MEDTTTVVETETTTENEGSKAPSQETKPKRTEAETTAYNLRKQAERAKELGMDPAEILEIKPTFHIDPNASDDEPLTIGKLREIQTQESQDAALKMADSIVDEKDRATVKDILENRIKPSGNPVADFALAQSAVASVKNAQIAEELARKGTPPRTAAGGSTAAPVTDDFVATPEEQIFMARPYNLTKEQILAKRPK